MAQTAVSSTIGKKEEEPQKASVGESLQWFKFYVMPILIFIFFVGMVFFFIVPEIRNIFDSLGKISQLEKTVNTKDQTLKKLSDLSASQLQQAYLYEKLDGLVPTNISKVVEFKERLVKVATDSGLTVTNAKAGEIIKEEADALENLVDQPLLVIEIPTELSANGSLAQLKNFLNNLYRSSDFFVVEEMDIQKSDVVDQWRAEFTIVKYQFVGKVFPPEDFGTATNLSPNPIVIDFLERKYNTEILDNSSQDQNNTQP